MKHLIFFIALLLLFTSCSKNHDMAPMTKEVSRPSSVADVASVEGGVAGAPKLKAQESKDIKLTKAIYNDGKAPDKVAKPSDTNQQQTPVERKIIRNGELDLEVEKPSEVANQIASLANSLSGFVVTSESQQIGDNGLRMSVVVRVPANKFDQALKDIRTYVGNGRVLREKTIGQDVTEEFVDLEARLRAKHALEEQFLEILKKATKVSDMLEVQNNLNGVRTEIEQIQGRLRFLENQANLSTITLVLQTPQPLMAQSSRGFFSELKLAVADGIETSQTIVFGLIRLTGVLVPIIVFLGTPLYLFFRLIRGRMRKN